MGASSTISRIEYYKNVDYLSNFEKDQKNKAKSADLIETQISESKHKVGGCSPVVIDEDVQKEIMNFYNEGKVYMDYTPGQIKNPFPSNCKSFQCYSEVSQIQGKGYPAPISLQGKYRE